jgi:hypothetical protein
MTELQLITNFLFKKFDKLSLYRLDIYKSGSSADVKNIKYIMCHNPKDNTVNILHIMKKYIYFNKYNEDIHKLYIRFLINNENISKHEYFKLFINDIIYKIYQNKYNIENNKLFIKKLLEIDYI